MPETPSVLGDWFEETDPALMGGDGWAVTHDRVNRICVVITDAPPHIPL